MKEIKNMNKVVISVLTLLILSVLSVLSIGIAFGYSAGVTDTATTTGSTATANGNVVYNTYVDNYKGFYRIQLISGIGSMTTASVTDFTINAGNSIQWVNDVLPEERITIVSKDGLWKDELANIKKNYLFSYTFNNPGTYDVYIKEYPNLQHQRITVVGYEGDVGTCEYPGNPPCSPLPVIVTPVPTPVKVVMDENSKNELNRLAREGRQYKLISIKDFSFVPDTVYADQSVTVFLYNEDSRTHYVKFSDNNNGYYDISSGTILGFCCGAKSAGTVVEYQDRDYPSMIGRTIVTGVKPPAIGSLKSYDNIKVWHSIELCNVASDAEREITEGPLAKNCGNPDLNIDNYPLDLMPSGGGSGKVSASEMVMVKIKTGGHIELIPWRTQPVKISWYNETGRLMFSTINQVNSINYETMSFIGHFSWEINEPGKYYVDIDEYDWGSARVVFDVTSNGQTVSPIATAVPVVTYMPTVTYTSVPIVTVNPPALGDVGDDSSSSSDSGGCWDSYVGFGTCAGGAIAKTGVGILLGIADTVANIFGL